MNYKTTLMLVLLLALVGGYFYFVEFGKISGYEAQQQIDTQRTEQLDGDPLFDDLASTTISRIDIVRGGKSVSVVKEGDLWFQTEPVRFSLNDYAPRSVARQFAELRFIERVTPDRPDAPTLQQMGLVDPRATVTVKTDDREVSLRLGKVTLGGHAYVQIEGEDAAYVVRSTLHGAVLDEPITAWRKTSLDVPEASKTGAASLFESNGYDIFLVKIDGRWGFDSKSVQRASQSAIEDWFGAAGRVSISEFIEDNPDNLDLYGLGVDYFRIQFSELDANGDEVKHTLHIGNADLEGARRYAAWTSGVEPITVVFKVDSVSVEGLSRTFEDLRDTKVIPADIYDVRELNVQQNGSTSLHLIRDPQTGYSFGDPAPGFDSDYNASHTMLDRICQLQTTRFADETSSLGEPIAEVQITLAGNDNTANFDVYSQGEDRVIVSEGESVGYLVPAVELDALLGTSLGLRDRTLMETEASSLERVILQHHDEPALRFEPATADGHGVSWKLVDHDEFEDEAFGDLLGSLNPLRVKHWLSQPVEPKADWYMWTLVPVGGAPVTMRVDPQTGRAQMSGVDSAFVLSDPMIQVLTAEYRDRTVLNIDIEQIESVELTSETTGVIIRRDGARYIAGEHDPTAGYSDPKVTWYQGELDQTLAAGVFDTLAGLKAERFIPARFSTRAAGNFRMSFTTTTDDQPYRLLVSENLPFDDPSFVAVELYHPQKEPKDITFTLPRELVDRLRAPLTEAETPIK